MQTLSRFCAATLLVLSALACPGFADNDVIRVGRVELYPTWSSVGIELSYSGDDARQADASFVWRRVGEPDWRNGVEMTFDRDKKLIWASVWPLEQGETIEVKIDYVDARLEEPAGFEGSITTRAMTLEPSTAGMRYYVSPDGNDFKPGTRRQPFRTLRHAAAVAQPGDAIYARGGTYREGDLFSRMSGLPGAPIVVAAAEGEHPILDGSLEIGKGARWESLEDGVYAIDLPSPPARMLYVAEDGERIFPFRSMEDIHRDIFETGWGDSYTVPRGWFYDADTGRLLVRHRDAASPADHVFNVAVFEYGVLLAASHHVVLRGFEIRNYGHACVRISEGATGCVVFSNELHNAQAGVFVYGEETAENAVWHNHIYERGLTAYSWGQNKRSGNQRQGITGWAGSERGRMGRGMSFCHNDIHGWFDGIMPGGWGRGDRLDLSRDMDIMYNTISDIGDDAIEIDSGAVNQRVHGNMIRNAFAAIAMAPVEKGPVYVTRNDATFYVLGFKLNVGAAESKGWAYCYHNAMYCLSRGNSYGGTGISFANGETMITANKRFWNNALIVDGRGIRFGSEGNVFDYNCYAGVPESDTGVQPLGTGKMPPSPQNPVIFHWETRNATNGWDLGVYSNLPAFHGATGQEAHGQVADPQFAATPGLGAFERGDYGPLPFTDFLTAAESRGADLRLQAGSPCRDAGIVIRGINEDFSGSAPDIGAFEFGGTAVDGRGRPTSTAPMARKAE